MMKNKDIRVGVSVTHKDKYGMSLAVGLVVAEASTRYGRRYVWVNYTVDKTKKTYNSAFWDETLVVSPIKTIAYPPTQDLTPDAHLL